MIVVNYPTKQYAHLLTPAPRHATLVNHIHIRISRQIIYDSDHVSIVFIFIILSSWNRTGVVEWYCTSQQSSLVGSNSDGSIADKSEFKIQKEIHYEALLFLCQIFSLFGLVAKLKCCTLVPATVVCIAYSFLKPTRTGYCTNLVFQTIVRVHNINIGTFSYFEFLLLWVLMSTKWMWGRWGRGFFFKYCGAGNEYYANTPFVRESGSNFESNTIH